MGEDVRSEEVGAVIARKRPCRANAASKFCRPWPPCWNNLSTTASPLRPWRPWLEVSEAALYRHFASKAQMFEGLIEFIEQSVFTLANQIMEREPKPDQQVARLLGTVLQFAQKNPGMCRVMAGDALLLEHERLWCPHEPILGPVGIGATPGLQGFG